MAILKSFRALYYNSSKIKNLDDVWVPPYDVISEAEKRAFFRKSGYNFARVILGKDSQGQYRKAARIFQKWQRDKILIRDDKPNFYGWEQKFYDEKKKKWIKRTELIAAVSLNDFKRGKILPHEHTLDAPKKDRLKILKQCHANLSPVFMMYEDRQGLSLKKIKGAHQKKMGFVQDSRGIGHTLWKIENFQIQEWIRRFFLKKKLYIVDGHHRFSTAMAYAKLTKEPSSRYILTALTNMNDPSLVVDPIYRALPNGIRLNQRTYLKTLSKYFRITTSKKIPNLKRHEWGILFKGASPYYVLKPKNVQIMLEHMSGHSSVKRLDVSILHQLIIPKGLEDHIEYIRGRGAPLQDAFRRMQARELSVLWLLKEASVEDVKQVADARQNMPPKSTYFYPKILSGPIIRPF